MSATFRYRARTSAGSAESGLVQAATKTAALARLRGRGLTPITLAEATHTQSQSFTERAARDLCRTLAQLLHSGLPLAQALKFASDELTGSASAMAQRLREALERGERPSEALAGETASAARLLRGVLMAGEASGKLPETLDVAAASFTRAAELNARVLTALIYPAFVLIATSTTLAVFVLFVTPALGQAFEGSVEKLPASTRALLWLSAWLRVHGPYAVVGLAFAALLAATNVRLKAGAAILLDRLSQSPLGLGIAARLDYATFARLTGLALTAGVPIAPAFEAGAASLRSPSLRARLDQAIAAIRVGQRPSHALSAAGAPPATLLKLVQVGEETGKLGAALDSAADLIANEAEQRLTRLGAIAGPFVILALGGVVGGVVLSLFLGLMSLSDIASLS